MSERKGQPLLGQHLNRRYRDGGMLSQRIRFRDLASATGGG